MQELRVFGSYLKSVGGHGVETLRCEDFSHSVRTIRGAAAQQEVLPDGEVQCRFFMRTGEVQMQLVHGLVWDDNKTEQCLELLQIYV